MKADKVLKMKGRSEDYSVRNLRFPCTRGGGPIWADMPGRLWVKTQGTL